MQPIFHLLALGVGVGGNANLRVGLGGSLNVSVLRYQYVGVPNALGVLLNATAKHKCFRFTVEYRLKGIYCK